MELFDRGCRRIQRRQRYQNRGSAATFRRAGTVRHRICIAPRATPRGTQGPCFLLLVRSQTLTQPLGAGSFFLGTSQGFINEQRETQVSLCLYTAEPGGQAARGSLPKQSCRPSERPASLLRVLRIGIAALVLERGAPRGHCAFVAFGELPVELAADAGCESDDR